MRYEVKKGLKIAQKAFKKHKIFIFFFKIFGAFQLNYPI